MKRYTISNASGKKLEIMLDGHLQHIWHTSEAEISDRVLRRVEKILGQGPYGNPCGHFGQAQTVVFR